MKAMKTMGSMLLVVLCIGLFIATVGLGWDWVAHGQTPWTIIQRVEQALAKQNDSDEKMRQWAGDYSRLIHALPSTSGVQVQGNFENGEKTKICTGYGLLENAGKDRVAAGTRNGPSPGDTPYEQSLLWVKDEVWVECN